MRTDRDRNTCHDGYNFDLAPGVTHVNTLRGGSFSQFDVRLSKEFKFYRNYGVEVIGEIFNLFNSKNPANFNGNCPSQRRRAPAPLQAASVRQAHSPVDPGLGETSRPARRRFE